MNLLILGGTVFLGRHVVDAALARGHAVTLLNRGRHGAGLFPQLERLVGDRDTDMSALRGRRFDAVIDCSGYTSADVRRAVEALADGAAHYLFVSSISVCARFAPGRVFDETGPLAAGDEGYGAQKARAEEALARALPGRYAIVRPGLIVGPHDPTGRFTYWPVRVARGGEVLAPGSPGDPLQWIDVRDLADWLVTLAEHGTAGTFNAIGPPSPARWGDVLAACVAAAGATHPQLTWVPSTWLEQNGMGGEDAFPIWVAPTGKFEGFHRWRNDRAKAAGLTFRPIADTVKAILDWYPGELERRVRVTRELAEAAKAKGQPPPKQDPGALRAGPKAEQEQELLAKWKASAR